MQGTAPKYTSEIYHGTLCVGKGFLEARFVESVPWQFFVGYVMWRRALQP
jgi:hypothetical protein